MVKHPHNKSLLRKWHMPKEVPQSSEDFNPFGEMIGLRFSKLDEGYSQCLLNVNETLHNPYGVLHGGVIYSLADTGMGGAVYSCLDEDELCASVEIKIAYFRFVTSGTISCESRVIHRSRRLVFVESEVSSDGNLIAKAMGTFSRFKAN
jgi:acyl-CoA thioesterase